MATVTGVRAMLARRPPAATMDAFGHVDVSQGGRQELARIMRTLLTQRVVGQTEIPFAPSDRAEGNEVLVAPLAGFDGHYQEAAPWSLERTVREVRRTGLPHALNAEAVKDGGWSFYAIRMKTPGEDVVAVRGKSPTFGLTSKNKLVTALIGNELKPVADPLVGFDHAADLIIVNDRVFVLDPDRVESIFVDAEMVKGRASQTAAAFRGGLGADLTDETATAVERACSHNFHVARRVERLVRESGLGAISAAKIRSALPDAGLDSHAFGKSGALRATTDEAAKILIDLAADLYYQPRFDTSSRRVGSFRRLKKS